MIDDDGRHFDRMGRQQPHQLNALTFVRAIPGLRERLVLVEPGTTKQDSTGMTVSCPCGSTPQPMAYLDVTSCICGRVFINGGGAHALVATT